MFSLPSSAHARYLGKSGGRWRGRSDDAQGINLLHAIMHPPPLCAIVAGMRASGSAASVVDVMLRAW